eukprot:m.34506 g.34506  ORF g.34506 m.34506 type:complete len:301 (+) comp5144_c0_seq1:204-1106(+)
MNKVPSAIWISVLFWAVGAAAYNPNLRWMSFYGNNVSLQKDFINLAIAEGDLANQFFTSGVKSIAPMPETGVYQRPTVRGQPSVLLPSWQDTLKAWYTGILPQINNGTIVGVFIGDEICCHAPACWGTVLTPLSAMLHQLFPPGSIIYPNECGDSIAPPLTKFPDTITHVSIDYYAGYYPGSNGTTEAIKTREVLNSTVYPRLVSGQRVFLVPGTFACSNLSYMPLEASDEAVADKLNAYWDWADSDPNIAGFNPWHFNDRGHPQHPPPCDMQLGLVSLPKALSVARRIGQTIRSRHLDG